MKSRTLLVLATAGLLMAACASQTSDDSASEPNAAAEQSAANAATTGGDPAPPTLDSANPDGATSDSTNPDSTNADASSADASADESEADSGAATDPGAAMEAETVVYNVNPANTTASYEVDEEFFQGAVERLGQVLGETRTVGSTSQVDGTITLSMPPEVDGRRTGPATIESGELIVDISTLQSDASGRDRRIRERWLESGLFPQAVFIPTTVEGLPDSYGPGDTLNLQVAGDITIREITRPVVFGVEAVMDDTGLSGTATTTILMTDFGFEPPAMGNMFTVDNEVLVTLQFELDEAA